LVGAAGTAARWNGTRWSRVPVAFVRDLWSVSGVAGGPVVAVGNGGLTLRFDGFQFQRTQAVTVENLHSVWIASPDTMLAVGENGALLLGDGATWSLQTPPTQRSLFSIWGTSMRDVFAVGPSGIIVHFDGVDWTEQSSGVTEALASVSGAASDDVFAVGTLGTILHYDGSSWSPMTSPTRDVLQCVLASAGDPIAVGANGTVLQLQSGAWSQVEMGATNWLYGVSRSHGETWVVGSHAILLHDGATWTSNTPGAVPVLRGVCTDPAGDVVVVGDDGYIARGRENQWSVDAGVDARDLHCVFRTRSGELFAGGVQRLLRFDGETWVVESEAVVTWHGFGESPTELYVAGSGGELRRRSGSSWAPVVKPDFNEGLNAVACLSSNEGYAVGDGSVALRHDGVGWNPLTSPGAVNIYDVIDNPGEGPNRRAFAVGASGSLFVINTSRVSALESPTSANLYALARDTNGDILAFGGGSALLRYHDQTWTLEESPTLLPVYDAWLEGDELFAVGGGVGGAIVLRFGPP
jgi:hypothetical protein